jgi:hypothetical protein
VSLRGSRAAGAFPSAAFVSAAVVSTAIVAAVIVSAAIVAPVRLAAQLPSSRSLPVAAPSRADSLLARGRLWAAEQALYSAVDAAPRAPAARGELGRYLASRGRFTIAEVLFREALRFGADTPAVAQALMAMAPFRPEVDRRRIPGVHLPAAESAREAARLAARATASFTAASSAAASSTAAPGAVGPSRAADATVAFVFMRDGGALGEFEVRGPGGTRRAVLDSRVRGLLVGRADDAALRPRSFGATGAGAPLLIGELGIGSGELRGVEARVDPAVPDGEVRMGIDLLWHLAPVFDEMNGTMTLSMSGTARRAGPYAVQIPFALAFPGMWLIPTVGESPLALSSPRARALLGMSRWWWDASQATLVVER